MTRPTEPRSHRSSRHWQDQSETAGGERGRLAAYDLAGLEDWFLDALAQVSRRHTIGAVIAAAHGCGAVLVDEDKPGLPMMDYDAVSPSAIDEAYARIAPAYGEVFCSIGAGAMRLAKQFLWQESAFPSEFARATLGAALLWRRFTRTIPVSSVALEAVTPLGEARFDRPGLHAAYQSWIALSEQAP
jgi:hypothetical protein